MHAQCTWCTAWASAGVKVIHLVVQGMPLQAAPLQVLHAVLELPPRQGVGFDGVPFLEHLQHPLCMGCGLRGDLAGSRDAEAGRAHAEGAL